MARNARLHRYKEQVYTRAQRLKDRLARITVKGTAWAQRWGTTILQAIWNDVRKVRGHLSRHPYLLVGIIVALFILFIWSLCKIPEWQVAGAKLTDKERLELMDKARGTIAQIWAGVIVLIGLGFTWYRIEVAREGQITERFTRAIDQLGATDEHGNKRLEIRLGGIYALERIARDSEKDHWPIMEVLTAYVREHAPWKESSQPQQDQPPDPEAQRLKDIFQQGENQSWPTPDPDIQTILTVIGRRTRRYGKGEDQRLNLHRTDLRGADLGYAHLEKAWLYGAHLEGAFLGYAHLEGAFLGYAHLEGVDLRDAHGLTQEQLDSAYTDENTLLPDYLTSSQAADDEDA